jgi:hypothetical protein
MARADSRNENAVEPKSNPLGTIARIYWMLAGYGLLCLTAGSIAKSGPSLSPRDVAFWVIAVSIIAVRYVDVIYLQGTTADGEPATVAHWRRYAGMVAVVAVALWAAAHGAALFLV